MKKQPCVYILKCSDGSFYTGWTNAIEQRVRMHSLGRGSRYTRGRTPVTLMYLESLPDKSSALRREAAIKKLPRTAKEKLITSSSNELLPSHSKD